MKHIIKLTLQEFIQQYKRKVEFACRYELDRYGNGLSHIDTEEFYQDAWVVITRNYPRYDPTKSVASTWIINICKTLGKYYYRRSRCPKREGWEISIEQIYNGNYEYGRHWSYDDAPGSYTKIKKIISEKTKSNGQVDPHVAVIRQQNTSLVRDCIKNLKKTHRVVLELHMQGLSVREITDAISADTGLNLKYTWTTRIKRRAMSALRKEIEKVSRNPVRQYEVPQGMMGINSLNISTQTANALSNSGIKTVSDLKNQSEAELLNIPKFGRRRLLEIKRALEECQ